MDLENPIDIPGAIAIVGLAGRFPQAKNLDEFWFNLKNGKEVVTFFSNEELLAAGVDPETIKKPNYVPARAVVEDAEQFDAAFFGYSPREAEMIDPQQRLFLECAWEALENAGYDTERYEGPIGVYGGLSMNTYLLNNVLSNPDAIATVGSYQVMLGNDKDFLTTRASYKLNLKGPSVNVQTACSTSLVAVQLACQSLLNYQCDMALAGGVSVASARKDGYLYQAGMIMSPDGHCRAFDHKAAGIVSGEGVGIVVLKRYAEAVRDGDTIHAIIRGAAINNDGAMKVGYTAPSVDGQTDVILMAQAVGNVDPGSITYIEAHGTGTELGDPIEISALTQAFRSATDKKQFCAIGSVKTHMGHLDAAAGISGLIKTVLALKNKTLPPNINFEKPNPRIDFENSPFYVIERAKEWETNLLPRRAGVSSFGIGGTNAHVVLEEAPPMLAARVIHPQQLLMLSARTESALNAAAKNLAAWLRQNSPESLGSMAYTLQVGRKAFKYRRVLAASTAEEAIAALEDPEMKHTVSAQQDRKDAAVVFMFTGQGSQYVNMGLELYKSEPYFHELVDRCAEALKPHLGLDLRDILYPSPELSGKAEELINQTWITQPALFTIEYALAKLWMSWGIQPQAMVGHSIGEYVAACLSGVFSLEDGLALVAARGKMMQSLPGGSMLSIPLAEAEILPLLGSELSLAVINAPKMSVVSGTHAAVDQLQASLSARGITSRKLHTSHAFHSLMMEPILAPFTELVKSVTLHTPEIPYVSNVSGGWITAEQATSPAYWAAHLRSTVRFAQNVETVNQNAAILLEVGPGQTLTSLARQHTKKPANQAILSSMRGAQEQALDTTYITTTLGRLWLSGAGIDWTAYHAREVLHRIPLPTYPFERKRYWLDPKKQAAPAPSNNQALYKRADLSSWFYQPSWQRSAGSPAALDQAGKQTWLVLNDTLGVGAALAQRLEREGQSVILARPGSAYAQKGENDFTLRPSESEDYARMLKFLADQKRSPNNIAHLWTLTPEPLDTFEELQDLQTKGFFSLLALTQAVSEQIHKPPVKMVVVSNQVHEVTGGEVLNPAKATLLGPSMVISQEYPDISCRSVDVILPAMPIHPDSLLTDQILAEYSIREPAPVIAYRGNYRWQQTCVPYVLNEALRKGIKLKEHGVYLITGGHGGIGQTLARHLAQAVQARLVLVSRTGLPERADWQAWLDHHAESDNNSRQIRSIQELEAYGASVLLCKADVANPEQMQSVMAQIKASYGTIDGVIHAAGTSGDGLISLKTYESAAAVLAPKVQGTWVLDQLLADEPMDFFILCSSINSMNGGIGLVDYSAANAYLDAFARKKSTAGRVCKTIAINWGPWQEIGMAFNMTVPAHLQGWKQEVLHNGIMNSEGIEAFQRILAHPVSQVIVSPLDFVAALDYAWGNRTLANADAKSEGIDRAAPEQAPVREDHDDRPEVQSAYSAPISPTEIKMVEIWQDLIGVKPIGIYDNFYELGGHSLMATQILSRIRDCFNIEFSLRMFFETNTVADLCKRIDAILWVEQNQKSGDSSSPDREEIAL